MVAIMVVYCYIVSCGQTIYYNFCKVNAKVHLNRYKQLLISCHTA